MLISASVLLGRSAEMGVYIRSRARGQKNLARVLEGHGAPAQDHGRWVSRALTLVEIYAMHSHASMLLAWTHPLSNKVPQTSKDYVAESHLREASFRVGPIPWR